MIIGLLILGSTAGILAAAATLVAGQSLLTAVLVYFGASTLTVIAFLACALRPRRAPRPGAHAHASAAQPKH